MRASQITVEAAAEQMGVTPMFLRLSLREGEFPFGKAVKFEKRWSYYINRERFDRWMAGQDIIQADQLEAISEAVLSKVSDYLDRFEQARGEVNHGEQNQGAW